VYDAPATPFVYQFLGDVNLFHSRVHGGFAQVGEHRAPDGGAIAYVRPHDIQLSREATPQALPVTVDHVRAIGPVVRLELTLENGDPVEAEMSREAYALQPWQRGERAFILPRKAGVFAGEDYAI
jgi:sulfate transport system ATP-binding protein